MQRRTILACQAVWSCAKKKRCLTSPKIKARFATQLQILRSYPQMENKYNLSDHILHNDLNFAWRKNDDGSHRYVRIKFYLDIKSFKIFKMLQKDANVLSIIANHI